MCECFVFWCEMGDSDRSQLQKGIAYKWHTIHVNFILEQMSTQWNRDCQKWHRYPSKCKSFINCILNGHHTCASQIVEALEVANLRIIPHYYSPVLVHSSKTHFNG